MNFRFSFNLVITLCSVLIAVFFLSSCAVDENGNLVFDEDAMGATTKTSKGKSVSPDSKYYSKGHYVYVNEAVLKTVSPSNSRIEVDLSAQRARLYKVEGKRSRLALETQISSGNSAHPTSTGKFRIMEKSATKQSNLYGKWVDSSTGDVIVSRGDSRKPPSSGNAVFRGAKMPYWLRITGGGIGLHIGYVPNAPASHGCIRVPRKIQPTLYKKVRVGTPVTVVN